MLVVGLVSTLEIGGKRWRQLNQLDWIPSWVSPPPTFKICPFWGCWSSSDAITWQHKRPRLFLSGSLRGVLGIDVFCHSYDNSTHQVPNLNVALFMKSKLLFSCREKGLSGSVIGSNKFSLWISLLFSLNNDMLYMIGASDMSFISYYPPSKYSGKRVSTISNDAFQSSADKDELRFARAKIVMVAITCKATCSGINVLYVRVFGVINISDLTSFMLRYCADELV